MRVAVFTGASRGIGAALAQLAGPRCSATIAVGRTRPSWPLTRFVVADLSDTGQVVTALASCDDLLPASELWFFDAAGVLPRMTIDDDCFGETAHMAFAVSAVTPLAIGAALAAAGPERLTVVHLTSGASRRPICGWAAYGMAKAAAALGWQTFAAERPGVRLHLVDPGVVDTDMQCTLREADDVAAAPVEMLKSPSQAAEQVLLEAGFPI